MFNGSAGAFSKSLVAVLQDAVINASNMYRSVLLSDYPERAAEFWEYYLKVRSLYEEFLQLKVQL